MRILQPLYRPVLILCAGIAVGAVGHHYLQRLSSVSGWERAAETFLNNNITLAIFLSALLFVTSWRRDRLTLSANLNKQIQDYNLAVFKDSKFAEQVAAETFSGRSAAWVQGIYAVFYTINMLRDSKHLREMLFVKSEFLFKDDEFIWLTAEDYPEQLVYILDGERGYHEKFKSYIWKLLRRRYPDTWVEDVRSRIRAGRSPKSALPT